MAMDTAELKSKGPNGTAMLMLHIMDDSLWGAGPKKIVEPVKAETTTP